MRAIAKVNNDDKIKRVMFYQSKDGVYLFLYDDDKDCSSFADYFYNSIDIVKEICLKNYEVKNNDWKIIDDPLDDCQHDWISPVRIKGRVEGSPQWRQFEKLVHGKWIEIPNE